METMLDNIGPSGSFDFWEFAMFLGAISAMLFQPALANFVQSVFVMIDPLSPYYGRIVIPFKQTADNSSDPVPAFVKEIENFKKEVETQQILKELRSFERQKNVCPLIFWLTASIVMAANIHLATSKEDGGL